MEKTRFEPSTYSWSGGAPARVGRPTYERLTAVLQTADAGRHGDACASLGALLDEQVDRNSAADLDDVIFTSAVSRRLTGAVPATVNLYLRQYERPQISLFNLLARHLPTVSLAGRIANELVCQFVAGLDEVTLLDVGIGTAQQEVALLHKLARRGALPRRLTFVAVEPSADSLHTAERALLAAGAQLGVEVVVRPVLAVAERLTDADWVRIGGEGAPLVVLSSFAAHHVRNEVRADGVSACARDALFARLRALEPLALVLCEPNADHHTPSFRRRFDSCWNHFGLTFDLIGRLDVATEEKAAMKMFFAREIEDILANAEESRCERHEPVEVWADRLERTGFTLHERLDFVRGYADPLVRVSAQRGYVGLDHQDETLVAVLCATAAARAGASGRDAERSLYRGAADRPAA